MVNRLIEPTSGRIVLEGEDVTTVDPVRLRRRMGYVIQQIGLFPHQTIADQRGDRPRPGRLGHRAQEGAGRPSCSSSSGLDPEQYAHRYPHELSGGQRQRVGVARALAADPPVLLMDEPFGAVDPIARDRLQAQFRQIQAELGKTVLLVTHDIDEAVRLADKIVVLSEGGTLEQYADPATVLGTPANDFVADFVGADRGLRRLAVTTIEPQDLEHPPTVLLTDTAEEAWTLLAAQGNRAAGTNGPPYAVVLDADGGLHGWVAARHLTGRPAGSTVADVVRRFEETVRGGRQPAPRARRDRAARRRLAAGAGRRPLRGRAHAGVGAHRAAADRPRPGLTRRAAASDAGQAPVRRTCGRARRARASAGRRRRCRCC